MSALAPGARRPSCRESPSAAAALIPAVAGALYAALRPRFPDVAAPLSFAALWMLGEWLRSELLGLPWILAALVGFKVSAAAWIASAPRM